MGTFSAWSYTAKCTVWEPTLDDFGQPSAYVRTVYACTFSAGGNLANDDRGEEFMPRSRIWLEADDANAPKVGSYVILAENLEANPPESAEIIRVAMKHDESLFNEGTPDRVLLTG